MSCHRTIIRLSAVLAVVALTKGCGDGDSPAAPPTPEPARPTTVTVSPATHELTALGTTVQLSADGPGRIARRGRLPPVRLTNSSPGRGSGRRPQLHGRPSAHGPGRIGERASYHAKVHKV